MLRLWLSSCSRSVRHKLQDSQHVAPVVLDLYDAVCNGLCHTRLHQILLLHIRQPVPSSLLADNWLCRRVSVAAVLVVCGEVLHFISKLHIAPLRAETRICNRFRSNCCCVFGSNYCDVHNLNCNKSDVLRPKLLLAMVLWYLLNINQSHWCFLVYASFAFRGDFDLCCL